MTFYYASLSKPPYESKVVQKHVSKKKTNIKKVKVDNYHFDKSSKVILMTSIAEQPKPAQSMPIVLNMISSFYKSLDSSSDISTDSTIDEDIIDKNALIYNKKTYNKSPLSSETKSAVSMEDLILPWSSFAALFLVILILFKFGSKLKL